ncbi:hypothetical protein [Saccharothrix deserti]|uniref:hypothetical protein n=1 Tax=Saccharothrix deserti TaxID=2593674 RepID=UPI00131ECD08|nr:hypothetical protein [Saccharothrix deserti]
MHDAHHDHAHPGAPDTTAGPPDAADGDGVLPPSVADLLGPTGHLTPVRNGRKRQVLIRFTTAELAEVEHRAAALAQRLGLPVDVAAFCHLAARFPLDTGAGMAGRERARLSREDALDLAADLAHVRRMLYGADTNLNQLARAANSGQAVGPMETTAAWQRHDQAVARLNAWLDLLDQRRLVHRAPKQRRP